MPFGLGRRPPLATDEECRQLLLAVAAAGGVWPDDDEAPAVREALRRGFLAYSGGSGLPQHTLTRKGRAFVADQAASA